MEEVERLVTEGERHKLTDEVRRELAELRNSAETLLYTTEQALEGYVDLVDAVTLEDARTVAAELRGRLAQQADTAGDSRLRTSGSRRSRSRSPRSSTASRARRRPLDPGDVDPGAAQ
jgi:molecular chaperone DnaK (HSP70)